MKANTRIIEEVRKMWKPLCTIEARLIDQPQIIAAILNDEFGFAGTEEAYTAEEIPELIQSGWITEETDGRLTLWEDS